MSDENIPTIISTPTGEIDASKTTVPDTRTFRDAWRVEGEAIEIDMDAAREITREKIRQARKPILEQLDVQFMQAVERGAGTAVIVADKQALRDATADPRIDAAQDPDELEAVLDSVVSSINAGSG